VRPLRAEANSIEWPIPLSAPPLIAHFSIKVTGEVRIARFSNASRDFRTNGVVHKI
jgi:hypothetical protein